MSVLICTYKRPEDLSRCLDALSRQNRLPDETILIVREDDSSTQAYLDTAQAPFPIRVITVTVPGTVAARNAGLDALQTDVVAMIDDDTSPLPDWLDRICHRFEEDSRLGALGGRDRPAGENAVQSRPESVVGVLQYCGRYIGNHHSGTGGIRPVDLLKGANMSFRAAAVNAIRFDPRLRGRGAQPCEDLAFSLAVGGAGWKVAYDPEIIVDHYEGARDEARHYAGMQPIKDPEAFGELTYNWVVAIWDHFSVPRHLVYILWQALIGTRARPGFVQALRFTPAMGAVSWQRFLYTQKAMLAAYLDLARGGRRQTVLLGRN